MLELALLGTRAMTYKLIALPYKGKITDLSKSEVKQFLPWFLEIMPERFKLLEAEVRESRGFSHWKADYTPDSLLQLGKWFVENTESRPRTQKEIENIKARQVIDVEVSKFDLTDKTYSLSADIGAYLGFILERQVSGLKWGQLLASKNNVDYGCPVLMMGSMKVIFNPFGVGRVLAGKYVRMTTDSTELKRVLDIWIESYQKYEKADKV